MLTPISVEKRLPSTYATVLFYADVRGGIKRGWQVGSLYPDGSWVSHIRTWWAPAEVTHWLPIEVLPIPEKGE